MSKRSLLRRFGQALADRDGGWRCRYCSVRLVALPIHRHLIVEDADGGLRCPSNMRFAQVDHVRARSKGGGNELSNLALSCGPCNSRKGSS